MNQQQKSPIPTVIAVLGATGDLMGKKIVPALFTLYQEGALPEHFRVVGFARRPLSQEEFSARVLEILHKHYQVRATDKAVKEFLSFFSYVQGNFQNQADYHTLSKEFQRIDSSWGLCSNKLLYLAVPPLLYSEILRNLAEAGLNKPCGGPQEGWTRVIVEKPFGSDEKSARALDVLLGKLFKEEQIYRIDHYLAKEMLQNILAFRFANNLFEANWDNRLIERIAIRLYESIGVEERGSFYDGVGALRDVGQNHLLQMLALVTMDPPASFAAKDIRARRAEILQTLHIPSAEEVRRETFRAQYEGYRSITGVTADSMAETYFRVNASLTAPQWQDVAITMESGKRMGKSLKEIEILFRHPEHCLCPPESGIHYRDSVIIRLEPVESIVINFWSKKPGNKMDLEQRTLAFNLRNGKFHTQYTEEYKKLLWDCIMDDQTLFVSSDEIRAMWRFVDPIIAGWQNGAVPLERYAPDAKRVARIAAAVMEHAQADAHKTGRTIGIVGAGKMGANIARRLTEKGWAVQVFDRDAQTIDALRREGIAGFSTVSDLIAALPQPRIVWLMVPAGKPVDDALFGAEGVSRYIAKGDRVIDGGNSFFEDTQKRAKKLEKLGIRFMDVGVSGGPGGARNGASLMIGGSEQDFKQLEPLFRDLAMENGYGYMGKAGAGHFIKMVHNGIEYGMMQAIAEGFAVIKKSKLAPNLSAVAEVYSHGSVITSRLVDWLKDGFVHYGDELKGVSGSVAHTGEGEWTIKTAKKLGVPVKVIADSFKFRVDSHKHPSYMGKILSMLRNQFGGHAIK